MTHPVPNDATPHAVPFRRLRSLAGGQASKHMSFVTSVSDLEDLNRRLIRLAQDANSAPTRTPLRRKFLTELIRTISSELWSNRSSDTTDAVHQVLYYISRNLSRVAANQWQTGVYDTFIDGFEADCQAYQSVSSVQTATTELGEELVLRLDAIFVYIAADPWGDWSRTHFPGRPDITCQLITLQRLQHQTDWETLASECNLSVRDVASFFQKQCLPKLRQLPLSPTSVNAREKDDRSFPPR